MFREAKPTRELLSGLLALQHGLIDQTQLFAALEKCKLFDGGSLIETLVDDGLLSRDDCKMLESQVILQTNDGAHSYAAGESAGASAAGAMTPGAVAEMAPGSRYRLGRLHACGGGGTAYVAHDEQLNREVVLNKMDAPAAANPAHRASFLFVAEVTGALEHPGILPVYSLESDAEGRPFYATRFTRGETLEAAIDRHHRIERDRKVAGVATPGADTFTLRLHRLLRRFVDVCNAIEYAHDRGVLHRDLKPSNIILGSHGETLVLEWGLASAMGCPGPESKSVQKPIEPSCGVSSVKTLDGCVVGTPSYMSPEQACGNLDRVDPRSDVYSLGATLYCILTGKPPFSGADQMKVLDQARKGEFPRLRQIDRRIPAALEAIVLKAMAREPERRYQTARGLADDVERFTAHEPVSARPESFFERAAGWLRRRVAARAPRRTAPPRA
jgi:serine/threonine protein kinase